MRIIRNQQPFWNCDKINHGRPYLIPFRLVDSSDVTDNYLFFEVYTNGTIEDVVLFDYETHAPTSVQVGYTLHGGSVSVDGLLQNVFLVTVNVADIAHVTTCFYLGLTINPYPATIYLKTEPYKIFQFDECDNLIRLESTYPAFDCLKHDKEKGTSDLPISLLPNTYATFADGAAFRNFHWLYGDLAWGDTKFTKTYEGFYNTHTRTSISENYELFLHPLPDWYAKELSNVLGGSNIRIWNNGSKVTHTFDCTELTLQQDRKACLVLATGVKLNSLNKTILIGCNMTTVLGATISQPCANFLHINADTFGLDYRGSTLESLLVQLNLGYSAHVIFQMYGYRTDAAGTRFEEHLIDFTNVTEIDVNFLALFVNFDSLVYRSAAEGGVADFDVVWVFKVTVEKPVGCDTSSYLGYNFRTLNFRTYIHRNITTGSTTVTMPLFQNKEISIL